MAFVLSSENWTYSFESDIKIAIQRILTKIGSASRHMNRACGKISLSSKWNSRRYTTFCAYPKHQTTSKLLPKQNILKKNSDSIHISTA